jgi:hypothetical protein
MPHTGEAQKLRSGLNEDQSAGIQERKAGENSRPSRTIGAWRVRYWLPNGKTMSIEGRIATIATNAREVANVVDAELARRIIYIDRARVLVGVVSDALAVMTRIEGEAVRSDFDNAWRDLRLRLALSQSQLERIIRGVAMPIEDHERI